MGWSEEEVKGALKGVQDPDLNRDLVELGMIKDIACDGENVSLTVQLTTPACPLKDQIGGEV
ncbi:MAG: iron-sulfur cluster assembly protein, partial [Planctomycetes bacterium]|nr:iron-sulfur cluster assembly protein [Planctomycetota bacterium]